MKPNSSRKEIEEKIRDVFSGSPSPKEIKKAKTLAMSKNVKFGEYRKIFCKNCYSLFTAENAEIRIKNGLKIIKCKICGHMTRWKLKKES